MYKPYKVEKGVFPKIKFEDITIRVYSPFNSSSAMKDAEESNAAYALGFQKALTLISNSDEAHSIMKKFFSQC